jgi:N-acetylneuraminic acid mutarotase
MLFINNYLRFIVAIVIALALLAPEFAWAQKWSRAAPFPEASEEVYGVSAGGKFYVFGGLAPAWTPKGLVYEYDPASDQWTKKKNMPLLSHHLAVTEFKGKIYVMGGFVKPDKGPTAWQPIDNAWEYDPANDTWKALASLPSKRGSAGAAVVNGKIYVIGGGGNFPGSKDISIHPARPHRAVGTNEVYDPATNTWETKAPMPTARNHAAIGAVNNKIYILGGRVGNAFITRASNTDIVEVYDPATDQWGPLLAPMPTPRSAVAWGVNRGRIYVVGGEVRNPVLSATYRVVEAYDPAINRWSTLPPMEFSRHGSAADFIGNKLYVVSGNVQSGGGPGTHVETDANEVLDLDAK